MNQQKNIRLIDLGSAPADDFDPFAPDEFFGTEPAPAPAANTPEQKDQPRPTLSDKAPVFEYADASENIDDTAMTFDELRINKALDFPELEDGNAPVTSNTVRSKTTKEAAKTAWFATRFWSTFLISP